ncbi:TauD/TfdA family dioxygenase [Parablastomonas sp. CN1-191]|uniref:TauD/TfdA family dioxygenase n=1 Tax=Parablastomonas sp. CN1-191 TaxID=3400908 RepID=UPI003BF883AA
MRRAIAGGAPGGYRRPVMARIDPPRPERPFARIEADAGETLAALDKAFVVAAYRTHGALLFTGFGVDAGALRGLADRLCRTAVINDSPGRDAIDAAGQIFTVNRGQDAFALHPELSREPWKPDAAFFACLTPPDGEGATTVCDGVALARALPADVRAGLERRRLVYPAPTWPGLFAYWLGTPEPSDALLANPPASCPYRFARGADGSVFRYFTRPALHRPMFADGPAFGNFLLFARFTNGRGDFPLLDDMTPVPEEWLQAIKAAGDALTARVEWQRGDLLVLDNTRFMHGRTAIANPAIRLIATRFGYLDFARPDPEEPADPVWRREDFVPPIPPWHPGLAQR